MHLLSTLLLVLEKKKKKTMVVNASELYLVIGNHEAIVLKTTISCDTETSVVIQINGVRYLQRPQVLAGHSDILGIRALPHERGLL
jgi:hypothetical protein